LIDVVHGRQVAGDERRRVAGRQVDQQEDHHGHHRHHGQRGDQRRRK
jgi:hypothetical protein